MKIYWSDREGNLAPEGASFSWRPFASSLKSALHVERAELPPPASYKIVKKSFSLDQKQWGEKVQKALDLIKKKELQKVVLARACYLELEQAPDPFAVAAALKKRAGGAFVFCMQSENEAFISASPERLFVRKERQIMSEAMAGTRRRGLNADEDAKLRDELLRCEKDKREFLPVQSYIQKTLSPLCKEPVCFTPFSVHQTQNVQHLYSRCSGELKDFVTDETILEHLHPTPALCGSPKREAFSAICDLEGFDRGLYGGAMGWSFGDESEWIVGIRSCLLKGTSATLFSGTGIVEGSDGEEEWEELNQKLKLYDGIFI